MNKDIEKHIEEDHKKMLAELIIEADRVADAQRAIVENGKRIAIDGIFGPQTAAAIDSMPMTPILSHMWVHRHGTPNLSWDVPDWIAIAIREIGVKEVHGARDNPRVIEYMHACPSGGWVEDDETPWCAGFVSWCMREAGYGDELPPQCLRAKSWLDFGVSAHKPVFGAIAVKSRKGGGHVGFVVGRNKKRGTLYILGGNQSDAVCVKEYTERVFIDFRIPADYRPVINLAKWRGPASLAGKEA